MLRRFASLLQACGLGEEARRAMWLRWARAMPYERIAEQLGENTRYAMDLIHEAQRMLIDYLEKGMAVE